MTKKYLILLSFYFVLMTGLSVVNGQNIQGKENSFVLQDTTSLSGEIEEVTVTAFRTPYNLLNTPAPVNLISARQLETGSALTPVEALNLVPGIVMQHGTLNTNRLTIRGIGARSMYATNKIKAYFGEIPLTSGDGETTLEDLENTAIKRVEIIKGPSSSLFGAGLGGAILFHPKTVAKNFVQNSTTAGSFGTFKNTLSAGIKEHKLNIFVLGSLLESDGFRENNKTSRANVLLHSQYAFSEKTNMQLLLKTTRMKAFIPSSIDWETFQQSPEKAAANWNNIRGFEEYLSGQFGVSLNIFTEKGEKISFATFGSFRGADELRPFNKLEENSNYLGWRGYIQKAVSGENVQITFTSGLEFYRENYNWSTLSNENQGEILSDNQEKRSYENLFFQMESGFFDRLFFSAGVNGNLTQFKYTDQFPENGDQSGGHDYKPVISPRVGVNFLITPRLSVFGNFSHGFSTPTFEETLLPEGEINGDIQPESGWNAEAGVRAFFTDRLQATVSYYRISISNLLVARRTAEDTYIGVNAGKSLHPGLEAEVNWNAVNAGSYPALSLRGNVTLANYHFQEFVDLGVDYSGKKLPGTAKNTGMAGVLFQPSKNFSLNGWYRFTGQMALDDANSGFTDPFGITNLEARYNGKYHRARLEIKGGIQNVFDVHYASMLAVNALGFGNSLPRYYYPGNPRNYFLSVLIGLE